MTTTATVPARWASGWPGSATVVASWWTTCTREPTDVRLMSWAATLRRVHSTASSLSSTACTRLPDTSTPSEMATAPLPAQSSTPRRLPAGWAASSRMPASVTSSVSGRGMKTPGPTSTSMRRNPVLPSRCCSGTRDRRRVSSCSTRTFCSSVTASWRKSRLRVVPRANATISAASTLGEGTPTAFSRCSASKRTSRTLTRPPMVWSSVQDILSPPARSAARPDRPRRTRRSRRRGRRRAPGRGCGP